MLIGFKIKNFRSYNEMQHFSMIAGKTRNFKEHIVEENNLNILKFSSIYGANASGKSNLFLAIDLGKKLIMNNMQGIVLNQYFKIDSKNENKPSYFEYEIQKNKKLYSYGFEININKKEIVSEWLIDMTKNKPIIVFERDVNKKIISSELKLNSKDNKSRFDICKKDMENNNNVFFLTEMIRRISMGKEKIEEFKDFINVSDFIINDLQIISPNEERKIQFNYFVKYRENIKVLLKQLGLDIRDFEEVPSSLNDIKNHLNNPNAYNDLVNELNNADFDNRQALLRIENAIYTIKKEKDSLDVKKIQFLHDNSNTFFDAYDESDGTLRILELIDVLFTNNKVFVIDEIDRSLHPALTVRFIKCFLKLARKRNNQLIITTHESRLLNFDILRRDEIWFSEKNSDGSTKLYSLEQFKDDARFDRKIDKAYLDGRYGAVPIFIDFPEVIDNNESSK